MTSHLAGRQRVLTGYQSFGLIGLKRVLKQITLILVAAFGFASLGLTPALAVDLRVIDVVAVTWAGAPAPAGGVSAVAKVIDNEVNADWLNFTTMFGDTKERAVSFKTGMILAAPLPVLAKPACTGPAAAEFMSSIRPAAYQRLGISDYAKRYLIILAPAAGCVWSGLAIVGTPKSQSGTILLHDSASAAVIIHELGHTFGLGHTNFLRCDGGASDGAWSKTCKGVEYGGSIDVMGNVDTSSPLSTYHQWRMGLLDDSQIKQVLQSQVVDLAPSDFANGIKALFIRDGKAIYWIEYRRQLAGVGYKPGLVIFRLDPPPGSAVEAAITGADAVAGFGSDLGADVWMLNLDTYQYSDARPVGGSMSGLTATTYSGNVSFNAVASKTGAVVTIQIKTGVSAPPTPSVIPAAQWTSPNMVILKRGNKDADNVVVGFESSINGVVTALKVSDLAGWIPTSTSPAVAPKTVYLRDLVAGSYTFSMRAINSAGTKSGWSRPMKVVIDRDSPVVTNDFSISAVSSKELTVAWKGATDAGSGICQVNIVDEDGVIIQRSLVKNAPAFKVAAGGTLTGTVQVFDCLGNGLTGDLSIENTYNAADKSDPNGKSDSVVTAIGSDSMNCISNCTASISLRGKFGLVAVTTTLGALRQLDRAAAIIDPSLVDAKQVVLAKDGFRADDFSNEWTVLPMGGGTTVARRSLDLCNGSFASEKDRVARRQVIATKTGSTFLFLSTEVVKYSSAAAASVAQKELVKVLAKCQSDNGYQDATGATVPYKFKGFKNIPAGVVSTGNRVFVNTVIDTGVRARTLLGFYQFHGDTLTGLYVMNTQGFSDAQVAKWLKTAATMAQRLQGNSA